MLSCFKESTTSDMISMLELGVRMDCAGCEKRIKHAISKVDGGEPLAMAIWVDRVEIELDAQKVTVTGHFDQNKILKAVRRTGRKAEFWPCPYYLEYHPFAAEYLEDSTYMSTYNYDKHGYNSTFQGYYPAIHSDVMNDHSTELFNEDNAHACTIM